MLNILFGENIGGGCMKRIVFSMIILILLSGILLAETQKIGVLKFEKSDRKSEYVTTSLNSNKFFKDVLKDYDSFELISLKESGKVVKESGYTNLFNLGKEQISELGSRIDADILIWGTVSSITDNDFKINAKVMSMKSLDVISETFNVKKASKDRKQAFKEHLFSKIENFAGGEIEKVFGIAMQHFTSKNYQSAEESFLQVLEIDEKNIESHFYLGLIKYLQDKFDESKDHYLKGLEIDTDNKDILDYLSKTYLKLGMLEDAINSLIKISTMEEDKQIWIRIGLIYKESEEIEEAKDAFDKAIEIDEEYAEAYKACGEMLFDDENYEEALPYLEYASEAFPDDGDLQKKSAKCLKEMGDLDKAIEHYKEIIIKAPENVKARMSLANVYIAAEQYQPALDIALEAKEIEPENTKIDILIASSYNSLKKYNKAEEIADKIIEADPSVYQAYRILSELNQARGYSKYEEYLKLDERSTSGEVYGAELDDLVVKRDQIKNDANAYFVKSQKFLDDSKEKTDSSAELKYIQSRRETLKKLLEATKKDFFE